MADHGVDVLGVVLEGRYRVDAPLARGGMSSVYSGLDLRLDRPVAIKVMESAFASDRSFIERFELEARAAAKLHHPGVVAVHDQGVDGGHVYLVMELVSGGTLRDLLREQGALPVPLVFSIMEPVLGALSSAHRAGLVHRDVKPENVLIGQGGTVKVADFGLVRAIATAGNTSDSTILGTVAYLSPEQVSTGDADARSDVYAAGILCYEMLTGAPPYTGDTPISVAYRHVNDDVPPPSEAAHNVPAALDDLVLRATRRDPAVRPADAAAFLDELIRVRSSLGVRRLPVPVPTPAQIEIPAPIPAATPNPVRGRHRADDSSIALTTIAAAVDINAAAKAETEVERTVVASAFTTQHIEPVYDPETTLRTATVAPGTIGPQGTMSIGREGYAPPPPPPPGQRRRSSIAERYEAQRQRSRRNMVVWISVVLVLAAILGVAAWWFGSGRWTAVPGITGLDPNTAEQTLQNADLSAALTQAHDDAVPAGRVVRTDPGTGARALRGSTITVVISEGKPIVPDITPGASPAAVEQAIKAAQLTPKLDPNQDAFNDSVPKGAVATLNPGPGAQLNIGAIVVVVLSKGPAPKPVPNVVGQPHDQAFAMLTQAGFKPFDEPGTFSGTAAPGTVIATTPAPGTIIQPGGDLRIGVQVSNGVQLPNFVGQSVQQATQTLQQLGLQAQVQALGNDPNAQVFAQSPPAGTVVQPGTAVSLGAFP